VAFSRKYNHNGTAEAIILLTTIPLVALTLFIKSFILFTVTLALIGVFGIYSLYLLEISRKEDKIENI